MAIEFEESGGMLMMTAAYSLFEDFPTRLFRLLAIGTDDAMIDGDKLALCDIMRTCDVDAVLARVGATVQQLEVKRLRYARDPVEMAAAIVMYTRPHDVSVMYGQADKSAEHNKALIRGYDPGIHASNLNFHHLVPRSLVRAVQEKCTSVRTFAYSGDMLSLDPARIWASLGRSPQCVYGARARSDREDFEVLIANLKHHSRHLWKLHLGSCSFGGSQYMELADLYVSLGAQIESATLNEMALEIVERVVAACPRLKRVVVLEDTKELQRLCALKECTIDVRLCVSPNFLQRGLLAHTTRFTMLHSDLPMIAMNIVKLEQALEGGQLAELDMSTQWLCTSNPGALVESFKRLDALAFALQSLRIIVSESIVVVGKPFEMAMAVATCMQGHQELNILEITNRSTRHRRLYPLRCALKEVFLHLHEACCKETAFDGFVGEIQRERRCTHVNVRSSRIGIDGYAFMVWLVNMTMLFLLLLSNSNKSASSAHHRST